MNNHGGGYDGGAKSARVTSVVESLGQGSFGSRFLLKISARKKKTR